MHRAIMGFSSAEFYDQALLADAAVAKHLLCELPGVQPSPLTTAPLEFIDTAGSNCEPAQRCNSLRISEVSEPAR